MTLTFQFRRVELGLLGLAGTIVLGGFALLSLAQHGRLVPSDLTYPILYVISTFVLSLWLGRYAPRADQLVVPVVAVVAGVGLLVVSRLSAGLGHKQLFWIVLGEVLACMTVALLRDVNTLRLYKYTGAFLGLILIAATIVGGTDINGGGYKRWIGFHGLYFQPVEILKPLMAIFFAAYLDEKRELLSDARLRLGRLNLPPVQYLAPMVVVWALSLLLLVKQNDLGSALLFLGIFLSMIYVGTSRAIYPLTGFLLYGIGALFAFHLFTHVRARTEVWLDPWSHAAGSGYQLVQGLIALAAGGPLGQGIGQGFPYLVPVVSTDFILSAIGEELGLAGIAVLLGLLLFLIFRGLSIALQARDSFQKLLAAGLVATLAIQTIVIVGGTTRLMPLTGVPLPFVSYGGSAALANYVTLALLLKVSAGREPLP
jgi:cell division protein FtsW (lipid II flippase)